jgi:hypothetical protein
MELADLARVAHEVNRSYCEALGDHTQKPWEEAPEWQQKSAINGALYFLTYPETGPEHMHEQWLKEKEADGWKYGHVKDEERKEHPCMVPFADLPKDQQAKDFLFRGVVEALRQYLEAPAVA